MSQMEWYDPFHFPTRISRVFLVNGKRPLSSHLSTLFLFVCLVDFFVFVFVFWVFRTKRLFPMQIDGEPWMQPPAEVRDTRELKHATFLRHGRQPEVNILHARTVVFSRFSNQ